MLADLSIHVAEYCLTGHQRDYAHVRHLPPFCPCSWVFLWEVFEAKDLLYVRCKSCEAVHGVLPSRSKPVDTMYSFRT